MRLRLLQLPVLLALALLPVAAAQGAEDVEARARALRRDGKPAEAATLLTSARAAAPRDERLAGLLGLCLLDADQVPQAQAVADEFPERAGLDPRIRTLRGRLAQGRSDWPAALREFEAALEADGRLLEPAVEAVRTQIASGRHGAAVTAAARVEALQPELGRRLAADALVAHADKLSAQGPEALGLAADKLAAAFELRPTDLALGERLLDLQVKLLRVADARALVARLYAAPADRAQARYWEGCCLDSLADVAGARRAFEEALAADRLHARAALELARLDIEAGAFEPARARLAALAVDEKDAGRRALLLGLAEEGLGHFAQAEVALRDALSRDASNTKAQYHLGRVLLRTGRAEEGRALLDKVAAVKPR